jgi:hypothetical protein
MKQLQDLQLDLSAIRPGTRCQVRRRFDNTFARGFEVAEVVADGYRVRRLSDGSVLPSVFSVDDIRADNR